MIAIQARLSERRIHSLALHQWYLAYLYFRFNNGGIVHHQKFAALLGHFRPFYNGLIRLLPPKFCYCPLFPEYTQSLTFTHEIHHPDHFLQIHLSLRFHRLNHLANIHNYDSPMKFLILIVETTTTAHFDHSYSIRRWKFIF